MEEPTRLDKIEKSINYLENRIVLLDNKASVLLAAITLYLGFLVYLYDTIIPKYFDSPPQIWSVSFLGISFVFFIIIFIGLLMVVRPTKKIFSRRTDSSKVSWDNIKLYSWYDSTFPDNFHSYQERINGLTTEDIKGNIYRTHFIILNRIRNKYKYYRNSVFIIKYMISFNVLSIILLIILAVL